MKLPEFKLDRYFQRHAYGSLLNLCASDCEPWQLASLFELAPELRDELDAAVLQYPEYEGVPRLRQRIAERYVDVRPDDVLVTTGAEEAIFLLMNVLLEPGMHIVVHSPCYQSLYSIAQSIGCRVSHWRPDERSAWTLDITFLRERLAEGAQVVVLNSPHSPTGACVSRAVFAQIVAMCRQHGARLLCDEVYRELEHEAIDRLPSAIDAYEHGLSLGDLSKAYGMPGLRIGWVATRDSALLRSLSAFKDFTTVSASIVSQVIAATALAHATPIIERNLLRVRANRAAFEEFLAANADWCSAHPPHGGTTALMRLRDGKASEFCDHARVHAGVLLLPGEAMDYGSEHVRVGIGREGLPEGLQRLARFVHNECTSLETP